MAETNTSRSIQTDLEARLSPLIRLGTSTWDRFKGDCFGEYTRYEYYGGRLFKRKTVAVLSRAGDCVRCRWYAGHIYGHKLSFRPPGARLPHNESREPALGGTQRL